MNRDLSIFHTYYHQNRLQLSKEKIVYALYHLNTRGVGRPLNISVDGKTIEFEPNPTYLGMKLDRSLTFKPHLTSVRQKVLSCCARLNRLAGTGLCAFVSMLRTSSLALVYPAAEYCSPAWSRSRNTKEADMATNKFCFTNNYWMPKTSTDAILANPCRHCPSFSPMKCRFPPTQLEARCGGTFQQ